MAALVSRQGRELQRYTEDGHRLVVGCIPYKLEWGKSGADGVTVDQALQVLVVSAQKGREMLFPRGGWESDESKEEATSREAMEEAGVLGNVEEELGRWWYESKSHDSRKMGIMFPLNVTEELNQWPEMGNRRRKWVTVAEARETCRQEWMLEALSILVARLSSGLRMLTESPPRNAVCQTRDQLGRPKRERMELANELDSQRKRPKQLVLVSGPATDLFRVITKSGELVGDRWILLKILTHVIADCCLLASFSRRRAVLRTTVDARGHSYPNPLTHNPSSDINPFWERGKIAERSALTLERLQSSPFLGRLC